MRRSDTLEEARIRAEDTNRVRGWISTAVEAALKLTISGVLLVVAVKVMT